MLGVVIEFKFSAAHKIAGHPKCGKLHGHNYRVRIWFRYRRDVDSADLCTEEIAVNSFNDCLQKLYVDLGKLKGVINKEVIDELDHHNLNDVFASRSVFGEFLAVYIYRKVTTICKRYFKDLEVVRVEIWETDRLGVWYVKL